MVETKGHLEPVPVADLNIHYAEDTTAPGGRKKAPDALAKLRAGAAHILCAPWQQWRTGHQKISSHSVTGGHPLGFPYQVANRPFRARRNLHHDANRAAKKIKRSENAITPVRSNDIVSASRILSISPFEIRVSTIVEHAYKWELALAKRPSVLDNQLGI